MILSLLDKRVQDDHAKHHFGTREILRLAVFDPTICVKDIVLSLDLNISRITVGQTLLKGGFKSFKRIYKIELSKPQKKKRLNWAMR